MICLGSVPAHGMRVRLCPRPRAHALARIGLDAAVIAADGRPMSGLGHYLELGSDVILRPAEMFASTPPKSLGLLACWGAGGSWPEQRRPGDPS